MKKRVLSVLLAAAMLLSVLPTGAFAVDAAGMVFGNLLKVTTAADFAEGQMENLEILSDVGDGAVALTGDALSGVFVSRVYTTTLFEEMSACWNASIFEGGEVEIWARARQNDEWSDWMTWGPYTPFATRGTTGHKGGNLAYVDEDTFILDEGTADGVQIKAELRRSSTAVSSPVLRMVSMTFRYGRMSPVYEETPYDGELPLKAINPAVAYSQLIRHPSIGSSICSPTTVTVMMNSRVPALDLLPEELALNVQDEGEGIFGNWSFCVAGAGLYGFEAYTQFASKEILMQELAKGHVCGMGVTYSPNKDSSYPYLEGAYSSTGGHLITIIGYEYEDGIRDDDHLYFFSSDSYSKGDSTSYHRYKWTQLDNCWQSRMLYIIPSMEQEVSGEYVTGVTRVDAELVVSEEDSRKFTLCVDGEPVDMSRFVTGGGVLGYTVEGFCVDMENDLEETTSSVIYEKPMQATANNIFYYDISCDEDGVIELDTNKILQNLEVPRGATREITVYAISDRGYRYEATLEATLEADAVIVAPQTVADSGSVSIAKRSGYIDAVLTVDGLEGDQVYVGLLMPRGVEAANVTGTVNGEALRPVSVCSDQEGNCYLVIAVDAEETLVDVKVDWGSGETGAYLLHLAGITTDAVVKEEGNLIFIDLENGRQDGKFVLNDGALCLADGETEGVYYSPVYDAFDWEYATACLNAYVPGKTTVDLQIRAYTQKGECWSDWYSFGKVGSGAPSTSNALKDDNVNMDTDIFTMRGSSSIANAQLFQARLVFKNSAGDESPAVYQASVTYKKSSYDAAEAVYTGETAAEDLPASAGIDVVGYSAYDYADGDMSAWRFENLEFMMMNGHGADLTFEEVAFANYDQASGWGNWCMTNFKPGMFGYRSYTQYAANSTLIRQALADGNLVGLYVHGGKVPSTNSASTSQTLVCGYDTNDSGEVVFKLICPRGDSGEVADGDIYGECTAAELDAAIAAFNSSSARGIMYVVGPKSYEASWQRVEAEAEVIDNESISLTVDGEALALPADFAANATDAFGKGGYVFYSLESEVEEGAKIADCELYYDVEINEDGTLAIPENAYCETMNLYVVCNNGVTYIASVGPLHAWDDGVVTREPKEGRPGIKTYTCGHCGDTYEEKIDALPLSPVGPEKSTEPELPFTDVSRKDDAYEDILFVWEKEIMEGIGGSKFAPERTLTRGQLATTLYRMAQKAGKGFQGDWMFLMDYTDVTEIPDWAYEAVAWCTMNGVYKGYGDGRFAANDAVTREQMITVLYRFAQYMGVDVTSGEDTNILSYEDSMAVSDWAMAAMQWGCAEKAIEAVNGWLLPGADATRANVAKAIHAYLA